MQKIGFSEFVAGIAYADLPDSVLHTLRTSFFDTLGVAAVGSQTELAQIAVRCGIALYGAGSSGAARVLMGGQSLSPVGAAMAGAFTVDSVDAHDGNSSCRGHAGSAVFPSLLAVADSLSETDPVDGRRFAVALACAYEVSYRAGLVQHATCSDYHTSGAWTAVGVAVGTALLLRCDIEQIRHAAGIGEYHGPRSQMMRCIDHPSMLRDGVGWGAPSGVTGGYLASMGLTGAPALTCESEEAKSYWEDLGRAWRLVQHTHYKAYPCCRWAHPAIDAVLHLMREHSVQASDISKVKINTFHYATRLAGAAPTTLDEFTYAICFPVAVAIARGQIGMDELHPSLLKDSELLRLSALVELVDDEEMTRISVEKRWAQVDIYLCDGRVLSDAPRSARGDPDNPLSAQELLDKYHLFADGILGMQRATELQQLAAGFDQLDVEGFSRLLDLSLGPVAERSG